MIRDTAGEDLISNKLNDLNWKNKVRKIKLDPTLNWK